MTSKKRATEKFFALRKAGYRGPIDHNGDPVPPGTEVEHLKRLLRTERREKKGRRR